jgi:hypothetical protein
MYIVHDEDEWETVVHHRVCTSCQGDMRKCTGACNGMSGYSLQRRKPEEVKRIKAERLRLKEDALLVLADAIRARRGM